MYTPDKFAAALQAARAHPVGAAFLAAYEIAKPLWELDYSNREHATNFITSLGSDEAIATLFAVEQTDARKAEYQSTELRTGDLAKRVYEAGLTKSGEGILTLAGKNSYRGDTIVDGGQLIIADVGSITSASVVDASAYLGVDGKAARVSVNGGGILGVGRTGITGNVLVNKAGAANVARGGTIGDLQLDGGVAAIDGRAGASRVNKDGVLRGAGRVATLAVGSGGTVAPGNSVGTLNVDGNALFEKGSQLAIESDAQGNMDQLAIGGKATLQGGTVTLVALDGGNAVSPAAALGLIGKRQKVITAADGVTGRFDAVLPQYSFLGATLGYDDASVRLGINRNASRFADFANTRNQKTVGTAIEALGLGKRLHDTVVVTTNPANLAADYDTLSGETHASLAAVAVNDASYIRDAMLRRLPHSVLGHADVEDDVRQGSGLVAWGQAIAAFAEHDGSANIAQVKTDTRGFATGLDKNWDDKFQAGVAFAHLDGDANINRPGSRSDGQKSRHVGGYLGAQAGPARFRAGGAWGSYRTRANRSVTLNTFSDSLSARYKGDAWQAFGEIGLAFDAAGAAFEPYVNITHVDYQSDHFAEKGGAAALEGIAEQKLTTSTLGLRSATRLTGGPGKVSALGRVNIGWRHDLDNDGANAKLAFAGGQAFAVAGAMPEKDVAVVDLDLDLALTPRFDFGLNYGGQYSSRYQSHSVKATLQWRF